MDRVFHDFTYDFTYFTMFVQTLSILEQQANRQMRIIQMVQLSDMLLIQILTWFPLCAQLPVLVLIDLIR